MIRLLGAAAALLAVGLAMAPPAARAAPSPAPKPAEAEATAEKPSAPKAEAAKPAAPKPEPLTALVKAVGGTVETRPAVGKPWRPVKVGMRLTEGADLRTGFRAWCVLDLVDSLVRVDPLTVVRIGELARHGDLVRTRLIMKHGHTEAVVEKERLRSDFAVVTPSATLSVRGTRGVRTGFYPVFGGSYSLGGPGLIYVRDHLIGRATFCLPGEGTDDRALLPIEWLRQRYLPVVLALAGLDPAERLAALRWGTSMPMPPGLSGPQGPLNLLSFYTGQQTTPGLSLRPRRGDIIPSPESRPRRGDITSLSASDLGAEPSGPPTGPRGDTTRPPTGD